MTNDGRQAGRTGHGAVWGSKKLKALSVRGTQGAAVSDPSTLLKLSFDISKSAQGPYTQKYRVLGTVSNVLNMNRLGILPTRNYQQGVFEHADLVSGEYLHEHYKVKTIACAQCPIACEQMSRVSDGPYTGAMTGIEYESLYATSSNCGLSDLRGAIKIIDICDECGMDTMSTGVTISWAMESFERGIFKKEEFACKKYPEGFEPWRWHCDPMKEGPSSGHIVTSEELEYMKDLYYAAKGWTKEGLIPKAKLLSLGMNDLAQEIGV